MRKLCCLCDADVEEHGIVRLPHVEEHDAPVEDEAGDGDDGIDAVVELAKPRRLERHGESSG